MSLRVRWRRVLDAGCEGSLHEMAGQDSQLQLQIWEQVWLLVWELEGA